MFPDLIEIGYLSKLHGYKGSLKADMNVEILDDGLFPEFLWINQMGKPVPFKVIKFSEHDKHSVVIRFEDIDSESDALRLKGETLYCEESVYDEYFEAPESLDYLLEYSVIDSKKGYVGPVTDIMEQTIQPNLVVNYRNHEVLIPLADELIVKIDEKKKELILNIPEGLLDIYL
jgi:16S rRNA processing protein RimM